jgi:hypothetical protein
MDTLQLTQKIRELRRLSAGELRTEYARLFGEENRSRNKDYLVRRICWRLQANAHGGITERARLRAEELADEAELKIRHGQALPVTEPAESVSAPIHPSRDPRLPPPGTVISREFKGQLISVEVEDDGFRFDGQQFKSLSAIAREVTGKAWNGYVFFGLGQRAAALDEGPRPYASAGRYPEGGKHA